MYKEKIVDLISGEETLRDYTQEEIAIVEAEEAKLAELKRKELEKISARNAIFEKLGLTAEEAAVLLG